MGETVKQGEKLEQIVRAAMRVFAREGFHGARMDQVAREAGVGKGTVYLYFSSKEALLEHIFVTVTRGYLRKIRDLSSGPGTTRAKLEGIFRHALEIADQNRDSSRFLLEAPTGMSEDFKRWLVTVRDEIIQEFVSLIQEGRAKGEINPPSPVLTAHVLIGAINSLVAARLWSAPDDLYSEMPEEAWPETLGTWAVDFFWPALKTEG